MPDGDNQPRITVQKQPGWLRISGDGFSPNGSVHPAFIHSGQTLDVSILADEVGGVGYDVEDRPVKGTCLVIVRDEPTGRFAIGEAITRVPVQFPGEEVDIDHGTDAVSADDE